MWSAILVLQDPSKDPQLSFGDFAAAAELDPDNADIYHHRGQVENIKMFWFDLHDNLNVGYSPHVS